MLLNNPLQKIIFTFLFILILLSRLSAQVFLEPDQAGIDYKIQGEYSGQVTHLNTSKETFALQIVALGLGSFQGVIFHGGLPGAGWTGGSRLTLSGILTNDKVVLSGQGYSLNINGDSAVGQNNLGEKIRLLKIFRQSPTLNANAPTGSKILFDGSNTEAWVNGKIDARHFLMCGTETKDHFTSFTLHGEFRVPFKPQARDQERGNSGIFIFDQGGVFEIQILDSFGKDTAANECGSLYLINTALLPMSFPPLAWQTYDIYYQAAKYNLAGQKTDSAYVTVLLNGVIIHNHRLAKIYRSEPAGTASISLQDHSNPIFFRNIWILSGEPLFPSVIYHSQKQKAKTSLSKANFTIDGKINFSEKKHSALRFLFQAP